jgi:hypothetical protein
MKTTVFLDVALFSMVGINRCFRGSYGFHHEGGKPLMAFMMETVNTSKFGHFLPD